MSYHLSKPMFITNLYDMVESFRLVSRSRCLDDKLPPDDVQLLKVEHCVVKSCPYSNAKVFSRSQLFISHSRLMVAMAEAIEKWNIWQDLLPLILDELLSLKSKTLS